jgi:hypothetical protein
VTSLYIVIGESGEYSDRRVWLARAFLTAASAAETVVNAERWVREQNAAEWECESCWSPWYGCECAGRPVNPHDAVGRPVFSDVRYHVERVEFDAPALVDLLDAHDNAAVRAELSDGSVTLPRALWDALVQARGAVSR